MALHTIVEHDTTHIKPYIDAKIQDVSSEIQTLSNLVEGATEITTKSFSPVIAVNDALPVNAVDVQCKIEPIQAGSGTPSPSNVRAISGRDNVKVTRCGKNLLNPNITTESDASYKVFGGTLNLNKADGTFTLNAGTYTVSVSAVVEGMNIRDENGDIVDRSTNTSFLTFTISRRTAIKVAFAKSGGIWNELTYQLESGSIATEHEPYNGTDYTIQLGDTYYGGTLDVTTGVLTVDRAITTLNGASSENWNTGSTAETGKHLFAATISGIKVPQTISEPALLTCDQYPTLDANSVWGNDDGICVYTSGRVWIYDSSKAEETVANWKNYLSNNPIQVVYELAEPSAIIQLTPQEIQMLQGNNTIFTDSGDTSIQYYANGVKNLEASVSAIQNDTNDLKALTAIFGTFENGTTASKPYAQGDYFVKNNKMCKAKTSIAKGATLTLNTNYEEFTLAEILKTIETA